MPNKKIEEFIDSHREEMLEDLKTLVRIPSMRGEALPGMPFGEAPARVLDAARGLMEKYGLHTTDYDHYVVTGDFNGEEKQLDILAHMDVVPVTQDWTVTQPFEPKVVGDRIYGRGTADDKGPAIAALYALRALKECGLELEKNVRLILGSDEECGSSDLAHYYGIEQEAPMSFTPDADFPVIHIEKGRLEKAFTAVFQEKADGASVLEFHGGDKVNVVPANAWAKVQGLTADAVQQAVRQDETGVQFAVEEKDGCVKISAKGLAGHASTPELGKNAVCALLGLLARLPLADSPQTAVFRAAAKLFPFGDYAGSTLGVAMQDEISGALTMNLGILDFDGQTFTGHFDSRVPICGTDETVTQTIRKKMEAAGLAMEEGAMVPPHHVPADSDLVRTLLSCYELYAGVKGEPKAIGGGTYVHELKRGVAFGCMSDDVDNHMHGDDEFMLIDVMTMSAKIFAEAVCRLCGVRGEKREEGK